MPAYYSVARFLVSVAMSLPGRWEVRGRENVPTRGGVIIASNHVSYWDPLFVGASFRRESQFLAKEELFSNPVLGTLLRSVNCIPIRRGVADLTGIARAVEALRRGSALLMFPEGSRMKDGELHPARPGLGMIAVHADVPIVPCFVSGSNRPGRWWTRRARVRVWFGAARTCKEMSGPQDVAPGRILYHSIGEAIMREIATLRAGQIQSASRGAA